MGGLLDLIPVFGPFVSSIFTTVFSFLTKGEDGSKKLWEKTKEYVNQVIDQKISDYDSQLVQAELIGLIKVGDDFRKSLEDYYNKSNDSISSRITPEQDIFVQFVNVNEDIRQRLPQFQKKESRFHALSLYTQASNLDIALLHDVVQKADTLKLEEKVKNSYMKKLHECIYEY
ncbi:insecticidal delta-endotoxin Cry8Ea1 family protein [Bacillus cereus]|nr:insecticidal delta-endotoxin Cry8Ea1 family protein [Bacillus cereus]MDF9612841.1 insecticidal delta-endotoxin Cry8Ea1 family protein [Bacillus cereus]